MTEQEFLNIFGDNLSDMICETGIGQNELARAVDVSNATMSRYINKQRMPSLTTFVNICLALNCNAEDLAPMYEYICE